LSEAERQRARLEQGNLEEAKRIKGEKEIVTGVKLRLGMAQKEHDLIRDRLIDTVERVRGMTQVVSDLTAAASQAKKMKKAARAAGLDLEDATEKVVEHVGETRRAVRELQGEGVHLQTMLDKTELDVRKQARELNSLGDASDRIMK
jgi:ABC-type uncharacterized transport system substrate-binding protein